MDARKIYEIRKALKHSPAQVGDLVEAYDNKSTNAMVGVLVGIDYSRNSPFIVHIENGDSAAFKHIIPITLPIMRPLTHKECFELVGKWVFRSKDHFTIVSDWSSGRDSESWQGCPISELVEQLENSPWRALEVEVEE